MDMENVQIDKENTAKDSNKRAVSFDIKSFFKKNKLTAALLAVILLLVAVLGVQTVRVNKLSAQIVNIDNVHAAVYDKSQTIQLAGPADRIGLHNYSLGEIMIPALEGVPVNIYKEENFLTDSKGYKYYYEDSELLSYAGIDVSGYNGEIDWNKVKESGIDFVMFRIGGRGYGSEGVLYDEPRLLGNIRAAKKAGLDVGGYFFSQAITPQEAAEEAEYAVSLLKGEKLEYPLAFDWEIIDSDVARTDGISPQTLTDCARAFCDTVKEEGYIPCLYTGTSLAYYKYDLAQLSDIDIWYAQYDDLPDMYYNFTIWQYSCTGKVEGIEGEVDLNICFKNYK